MHDNVGLLVGELEGGMYEYKDHFYRFLASFAVRSAEQIVPLLSALLPINSVVDFGCGHGAWLSIWRKAGANVMGLDGPYVNQQHLMIDANEFRTADLSQPIDLGRRFDLVSESESEWLYYGVDTLRNGQANLLIRSCTEAM